MLIERNKIPFLYFENMTLEKSQIKFAKSNDTGEIIGFVSIHPKTKRLNGVREGSQYRKKICVLAENLKGTIDTNILYDVELKQMHNRNGYVVVSAVPVKLQVQIETITHPKGVYQVTLNFGYKTIYFDPRAGKTKSSNTIEGVIAEIKKRNDIADIDEVIKNFKIQAEKLISLMHKEKFQFNDQPTF